MLYLRWRIVRFVAWALRMGWLVHTWQVVKLKSTKGLLIEYTAFDPKELKEATEGPVMPEFYRGDFGC